MRLLVTGLAILFLAVGCSAPAGQLSPSLPTSVLPTPGAATPVLTPAPEETPQLPDLSGDVPEELLLQILQQVSDATGVALADLVVQRADAVTWSDGSLGCPEPGMMYTQALVDGFWVVVEAGGETYDFHANQAGNFMLCPPGRSRPPIAAGE